MFSAVLQTCLLPPCIPAIPGLETAALLRPAGGAQVGGNFYDLFPVAVHAWGFVIGDVAAKVPWRPAAAPSPATAFEVPLSTGTRQPRRSSGSTQALLAGVGDLDEDSFCTLILALIEPTDRGFRVSLAVGGHPLPTVLRRDGTVTAIGRHRFDRGIAS